MATLQATRSRTDDSRVTVTFEGDVLVVTIDEHLDRAAAAALIAAVTAAVDTGATQHLRIDLPRGASLEEDRSLTYVRHLLDAKLGNGRADGASMRGLDERARMSPNDARPRP